MAPTNIKPVYILFGDDEYIRDSNRRGIVSACIGDGDPQVCVSTYDCDIELAVVLDELRTLPFLAAHRVVLVSQADVFISANRDKLETYLASPSSTGTLVLLCASWPSNTKLYKAVAKVGEAIDCSVPKGENLSRWIAQAAQKRGKKIGPQAVELLSQWVGRDMAALDSEVEKLSIYATSRPEITAEDVNALVAATAGPGAFDLTNAITAGDAKAALTVLSGLLTKRGEEFKTLGLLGWHLRRAMAAQQNLRAGMPPAQAIPKMPYEQVKAFTAMLQRRSKGKLLGDFRRMIKADLAMKSGTDPLAAMQMLVVGMCT